MICHTDDLFGPKALTNPVIEPPNTQSALDRINNNLPTEAFQYGLLSQTAVGNSAKNYPESTP